MKKGLFLVILLGFSIVISGCGFNVGEGNNEVGDKQNGTDLLRIGTDTGKDREQDVDQGQDRDEVTDQNPNFLHLNSDDETHVNNIGMDIEKARAAIRANKQFEEGSVWTNGNNMNITVTSKRNLDDREERKAQAKLRKQLIQALPTYDINVTIENR